MTPAARIAAAIHVLDEVLAGKATEQALTSWGRANRYAGSKDRAAVRDHVFDAVRNKRIYSHLGGAMSGRAVMLGQLSAQGVDPRTLFTGEGYAPSPLEDGELVPVTEAPEAIACNLPDWVYEVLYAEMGPSVAQTAKLLSDRAPVCLRVNTLKSTLEDVLKELKDKDIPAHPSPVSNAAILIDGDVRGLRNMPAFLEGRFEFQDAASQALVDEIPLSPGDRVLDYCAGGGGKTLGLAARLNQPVFAHDANAGRLKDLPARAARAGAQIEIVSPSGQYDVVLCDVPCSGSGAWRRAPDGKWALTEQSLSKLNALQDEILDEAAQHVSRTGHLIYATCSILRDENERRIEAFLDRHRDWTLAFERRFMVSPDSDGFYTAHVKRH